MTQGKFTRLAESARQPKARIFLAGLLSMLAAPVGGVAPAFAQTFLTFRCADGTEFVAVLRQGTRNAYVQLDGKAITLPRRLSLSGARYSAGRTALRIRQNSATLSRGRQSTECSSN
jgi:membrane-bound inhibitor of C-type lysozyme